ncbi:MAG: hypothetical protein EXR69_01030 [Myxococcales bacterium]|nr:hypothetical protein [Myxococcales bacterium]
MDFEGGAWAPLIELPWAGDFVVVMNVGGPGGVAAGFVGVSAGEEAKGGCSSAPGQRAGGVMIAMGALATAMSRRGRR